MRVPPSTLATLTLLALFPLSYCIDANFLGAQSMRGLESPLPRLHTALVMVCGLLSTLRRPRATPLCWFGLGLPAFSLAAYLAGLNEVPDTRLTISLCIVCILAAGDSQSYVAGLTSRSFRRATTLSCLVCLGETLREIQYPIFFADNIAFSRVAGGFPHPNAFAMFCLAMFAAVVFFEEKGRARSLKSFAFVFCIVATRSVTATALLGALWLVGIRRRSWKLWAAVMVLGLVAVALTLGVIPFPRADEIQQMMLGILSLDLDRIEYGSFYWRLLVWRDSLQLMLGAGWTGYGLGTFADVSGVGNLAHNVYVQLVVEAGYVGLLLYVAGLVGQARLLHRSVRRREGLALWGVVAVGGLTLNVLNYSAAIYCLVVVLVALAWRPRAHRGAALAVGCIQHEHTWHSSHDAAG